jgi:uncharacterized membrane protein
LVTMIRTATTLTRYWLWAAVALVAGIVFWASPGDYGGTAHAVLHGLCAQTPSHTLRFGDRMLPFDARMTGIYGGLLVTFLVILMSGRLLSYGNPPRPVVTLLGGLVALMATDGFNSLLTDLGIWHPYEPSNALRVATGYGAGIALAVALCWLLSSSLWNLASPAVAVRRIQDLSGTALGLIGYGLILAWRPEWLHLPVAILLVASAWLTVSLLMLVIVLLGLRFEASIRTAEQLHVPVAMAALLAISVMLGLAGARFWLERTLGITNAMM